MVDDKVEICIDRGGTFCDVIARSESKGTHLVKLLSVDPAHYEDAPREGVRRVLEWFTGKSIPRSQKLDTKSIKYLRMGTTVATNALLERKGEKCALLTTKGFGDCLEIGTQSRPELFSLAVKKHEVLYSRVVEVDARVAPEWPELDGEDVSGGIDHNSQLLDAVSGKRVVEVRPVDTAAVLKDLQDLYAEGYRSIAIAFVHSYMFSGHEKQVADLARKVGFPHISVSSELQPMVNLNSRGSSAVIDAYLTPAIQQYLDSFASGFEAELESDDCEVSFMQSDGALCNFRDFSGLKAILSGPAGGVVGFARTSYDPRRPNPVVGFDMGGTSTDVSRYSGTLEHVFETTTAGIPIQTPQLDINTVAAGGGSILHYKSGLFSVGPDSAGAHPGPACYRKGGPLTVTDANLLLGRLDIESFPKIFGPSENLPLDVDIVREKFAALTKVINAEMGKSFLPEQVASGFIDVANTAMSRPIRALTEQRGFRTSDHNLACFGGAGGQHACAVARELGMPTVIVHKYSSVLSAYGMSLADVAIELSEACLLTYGTEVHLELETHWRAMEKTARGKLLSQKVPADCIVYERYLQLRYTGSDTKLMIRQPADGEYGAAFIAQHQREFGFVLQAAIEVDLIRLRGVGKGESFDEKVSTWVDELELVPRSDPPPPVSHLQTFFEDTGRYEHTPLYRLGSLPSGSTVVGPAIILDETQTILLHPRNTAIVLGSHVIVDVGCEQRKKLDTTTVDPIQVSIFGHRFMGIAEQMGRTLQKTSVSLQIKERLDFSCAIFGPDALLIANAPNVPIHLGSMQYAVKWQADRYSGELRPGDILVSNSPEQGGTHLPDITVMQPVFDEEGRDIIFWVAARGHHTDIGGLEGSPMHPDSQLRSQEGAEFTSNFLVRDGVFQEQMVLETFKSAGKGVGCLSTRRLDHNLSDLKAQCAACAVGVSQMMSLMEEYGRDVVHFYMTAIMDVSELGVRHFLKSRQEGRLHAVEMMDDGTEIVLNIDIDSTNGTASFDFEGTGCEVLNHFNAPESVTRSAITYVLRVLLATDLPMNAGLLAPVTIAIPKGSILSPSVYGPVYLGNAETAQRVTDTILKAFEACANSHGGMSVTMLQYKEYSWGDSICGGAGAGPTWAGADAVQVHMTNTRTGDVEIIESRFPALLREMSIRRGSGGLGANPGGCGVTRIYEGRVPLMVVHSGERKVVAPEGLHGGAPGGRGSACWKRRSEDGKYRTLRTRPNVVVRMQPGEQFIVRTPGGGGYGHYANGHTQKRLTNGHSLSSRANGSLAAFTSAQDSS